jgi:hypothetical protein
MRFLGQFRGRAKWPRFAAQRKSSNFQVDTFGGRAVGIAPVPHQGAVVLAAVKAWPGSGGASGEVGVPAAPAGRQRLLPIFRSRTLRGHGKAELGSRCDGRAVLTPGGVIISYAVSDVLSASAVNLGNSGGSGFSVPVASLTGATVTPALVLDLDSGSQLGQQRKLVRGFVRGSADRGRATHC